MAKKSFTVDKNIKKLFDRVKNAEEYHKQNFVKKVEANSELLRGNTGYMPKDFEYDIINPNLIFSTIRNYVPSLYPKEIKIFAKPRAPEWGEPKRDNAYSAFVAQNVLDYYQYELNMKKTDKMAILGSLIHGVSYVMDAWNAQKGNVNPTIIKDQPMHRFVSGLDLIPDPDGLEFEDKSFVVRVYGKRYDQMSRMGFSGFGDKEFSSLDDDNSYSQNSYDNKTRQPILPKFYEIWDKNTEKVYTMTEEGQKVNGLDVKDWDIADGFPFTPLILNPMIDNFYPISLIDVIKEMQKYLTLMISFGVAHTKKAIPKQMAFKEYMDRATLNALKSGKDMDLIPLTRKRQDDNTSVQNVIASMDVPRLPADYYNMMNIVRDFINTISGVSESARGGIEKQDTATGAAIIDNYLRSRIGDYKDIVDDFIIESRRKMLKQIKRNASSDKYLRFNKMDLYQEYFYNKQEFQQNPNVKVMGNYVFIPWNNEEISNEYDLTIGVGAGLPANEEFTYKKALNNYNLMANDPSFDRVKVRLHLLNQLGIPDAQSWITPPPPPSGPDQKINISLTLRSEDLPPEELQQILTSSGLIKDQQLPAPGQQGGNKVGPVDVGLQRELGIPGLQQPPSMPEIQGGK